MGKPRKGGNWKKLELQRAEQIAATAAKLEKWAADGADVCLLVYGPAFQLSVGGSIFRNGKDGATHPAFTFASRSREMCSTIALGIYDWLELRDDGTYQVVILKRAGSQIALVRFPKGKEIDVLSLPTPWGTN